MAENSFNSWQINCFSYSTSGDVRTTSTYFKKLNPNKNFIFIKIQIERWIKWRKNWEPTNLDRNQAPPLAAFTILNGLCNWINFGEAPEQTTDNKRNERSNQNNNQNESLKQKEIQWKKYWIRGPACWSRCSCRRRVWTPSRGLDAASTVTSVETALCRRSPAAGLGRLRLPPLRRPRLRRWVLE